MSSNDQPQDRFVEIDASPNTVIDIGGGLIYSKEFIWACLESAYNNFGSRLYDKLRAKNIPGSVNFYQITDARGIPVKLLRPSLPWVDGRVRVRLIVEFEPEDPGSASDGSSLDDLRKDAD
ncbi:KGK domain-containing protein [Synechococcus sp. B60.1]|uniref:KGK domain-containing protein n=1 Tax=unclassified Synechococcus TaxID=2626047 RepID=UPI0039C447CE